jgi:hypothetical protein
MTFGPFLSGELLTAFGWNTALWLSFAPLAVAVAALAATSAFRPIRAVGSGQALIGLCRCLSWQRHPPRAPASLRCPRALTAPSTRYRRF